MTGATASDLRVFIPLTKIDIEKRLVYGVATAELPDLSGEVCDYASTKPLYEKWSDGVSKASGGKSLGNLRSMHGPTAAGKVMDISFNDDERSIEICAKVVDDNEWQKVVEGVYTGFSQGGRYVKRWADKESGLTKYTADPSEISLVDLPCLPSATFEVMKAEGVIEKRAFVSVVEEPETDAIKAEARALAGPGKSWHDFAEAATAKLMKAQMSSALDRLAKDFDESKHPRDSSGRWSGAVAGAGVGAGIGGTMAGVGGYVVGAVVGGVAGAIAGSYQSLADKGFTHDGGVVSAPAYAEYDQSRYTHSNMAEAHSLAGATAIANGDKALGAAHASAAKAHEDAATSLRNSEEEDVTEAAHNAAWKATSAANKSGKAKKAFEPEQLWACGCSEHKHVTKAEAVGCMKKRAADESTAAAAAPVTDALAKIEAELGIAKAAPAQSAGDAHRDAADAHDAAGELHEGMAAHDDVSADDAAQHFSAAAAHSRASAAHRKAAVAHDAKDPKAEDASKKAGLATGAAAKKSDAMFAQKCVAEGGLTKYSEDEARGEHGRWASGAQAKSEATSVTSALAASAVAMGVGEAAAHAGKAVGAKVGRLAGKALALAASKGNTAAGEGGALVGAKVGSIAGSIAGRMYGEARGWSMAAGASKAFLVVGGDLAKGLYQVSRLASIIDGLSDLHRDVAAEAAREGDGSPLAAQLRTQIEGLSGTLIALAQEETSELFGSDGGYDYDAPSCMALFASVPEGHRGALIKISENVPGLKPAAGVLEKTQGEVFNRTLDRFVAEMQTLVKAGARNSSADADRLQKAHDLLNELGASCPTTGTDAGEEVEKFRSENVSLRKTVDDFGTRLAAISDKLAEMGKRAAPAKAAVRAIGKEEDGGSPSASGASADEVKKLLDAMPAEERALLLMKASLAKPVPVIR